MSVVAHASFLSERLHRSRSGPPARPQHPTALHATLAAYGSPTRSELYARSASQSWVSALPSLLPSRVAPTPHIESIMSVEPEPRRRAGAQRPTPKRRRANQTSGRPTAKRIRLRRHKLSNRQNATSRVARRGTRCAAPQLGALPQLPEEELSLSPSRSRGLGAENVRDASARG